MNTVAEIVDVVDELDRPVRTMLRPEVAGDFVNTRYACAFVTNSAGEIWVPTRKVSKPRWPGGLDFAMAGAVEAGEDYLEAAVRETAEELGRRVRREDFTELAYLSPYKFPIGCFLKVFELRVHSGLAVTDDEYSGARWYTVSELICELYANRDAHKSDLLPVVRLCFGAMDWVDRSQFSPKQ